ncbi:type II toxin-antitoxin system VapC family toxin [Ramlibacter albus]|uniref:Type II toxin-antitoxin system VapC family toxin n=1 Tax=Ramlibacter albus TaxID=2079448 RepID=A0A923M7H7_9BURK|nr:type II toxin-antitoxin system VapC family toxin [Ramlibacter albus]
MSPLYVAEPPARYFHRPPVVLDCSVLASVLFKEASREEAAALLVGKSLQAPHVLDSELASVALKKKESETPEAIENAFAKYHDYDIELHPTDARGQYELARRYQLSAYDAAYLWLASALHVPLLTFDKKLAKAAREHLAGLA